nr:MAG TPA: hypothetical protein [Caudoviricetes sp.]
MRPSETFTGPGYFVWQRVWSYPDVQIQPLDAETVEQSSRARVWVEGAIAAHLHRSDGRWGISLPNHPEPLEISGSTAASVVSNWLLPMRRI